MNLTTNSRRGAPILVFALLFVGVCLGLANTRRSFADQPIHNSQKQTNVGSDTNGVQSNSLCAKDEQNIFSCVLKRSAKIVSLCASRQLKRDRGYLQYRFGLPGQLELEYPKQREGTQQFFRYMHYFRAQVDMSEITFKVDGYEYSVFDDYNGEERPVIAEQGVRVSSSGNDKQVTLVCKGKAKNNLAVLQDVLPHDDMGKLNDGK